MGSSQAALAGRRPFRQETTAAARASQRRPGGRRRAAGTLGQPFSCTWTGPYQTPAGRISSAVPFRPGAASWPGVRIPGQGIVSHRPCTRGSWGRGRGGDGSPPSEGHLCSGPQRDGDPRPCRCGLAISAAVLLVTSFVVQGLPTALITAFVVCMFGGFWFAFALTRRQAQRLKFPVPLAAAPYPGRPRLSPLVAVRTPMDRQPSNATHRRASARCERQRQEVEESDEEVHFGPGQGTSPQTQDQRQSPSNQGSLRSVRDFARKTSQELNVKPQPSPGSQRDATRQSPRRRGWGS